MAELKKRFTSELRAEAVRLAQTSGRSRRAVAEDLGIGLSTLRNWIDGRRDWGDGDAAAQWQGDLATERRRLRREDEVMPQEREILK